MTAKSVISSARHDSSTSRWCRLNRLLDSSDATERKSMGYRKFYVGKRLDSRPLAFQRKGVHWLSCTPRKMLEFASYPLA